MWEGLGFRGLGFKQIPKLIEKLHKVHNDVAQQSLTSVNYIHNGH